MDFVRPFPRRREHFDYCLKIAGSVTRAIRNRARRPSRRALGRLQAQGADITHFINPEPMPAVPKQLGARSLLGARGALRDLLEPSRRHRLRPSLVMLGRCAGDRQAGYRSGALLWPRRSDLLVFEVTAETPRLPKRRACTAGLSAGARKKKLHKSLASPELRSRRACAPSSTRRQLMSVAQRDRSTSWSRQVQVCGTVQFPRSAMSASNQLPARFDSRIPMRWPSSNAT